MSDNLTNESEWIGWGDLYSEFISKYEDPTIAFRTFVNLASRRGIKTKAKLLMDGIELKRNAEIPFHFWNKINNSAKPQDWVNGCFFVYIKDTKTNWEAYGVYVDAKVLKEVFDILPPKPNNTLTAMLDKGNAEDISRNNLEEFCKKFEAVVVPYGPNKDHFTASAQLILHHYKTSREYFRDRYDQLPLKGPQGKPKKRG